MTIAEDKAACRKRFFDKFYPAFFKQLENGMDMLEPFGQRVQERWLYGFIGQALSQVLKDKKNIPLVLTEIPVAKREKSNPGRVDFVFQFEGYLIFMEVKAGICKLPSGDNAPPVSALIKLWKAAGKQLTDIKFDRRLSTKADNKKSVRLALLLVSCGNKGNKKELKCISASKQALENLQGKINNELKTKLFAAHLCKERMPHPRKAQNTFVDGPTKMRRDFGWMLFAGYK